MGNIAEVCFKREYGINQLVGVIIVQITQTVCRNIRDDGAVMQKKKTRAEKRDGREIVRDEEPGVFGLMQLFEKRQYFSLDRNIQRAHGFIKNSKDGRGD